MDGSGSYGYPPGLGAPARSPARAPVPNSRSAARRANKEKRASERAAAAVHHEQTRPPDRQHATYQDEYANYNAIQRSSYPAPLNGPEVDPYGGGSRGLGPAPWGGQHRHPGGAPPHAVYHYGPPVRGSDVAPPPHQTGAHHYGTPHHPALYQHPPHDHFYESHQGVASAFGDPSSVHSAEGGAQRAFSCASSYGGASSGTPAEARLASSYGGASSGTTSEARAVSTGPRVAWNGEQYNALLASGRVRASEGSPANHCNDFYFPREISPRGEVVRRREEHCAQKAREHTDERGAGGGQGQGCGTAVEQGGGAAGEHGKIFLISVAV